MTAALELGTLTTELVNVTAAQTGLPVGDAVSPISGEPAMSDYPYVVVYEVSDVELPELLPVFSTVRVVYQFTCVGLTRLQAARARDFVRTIQDASVVIETATARLLGDRRTNMSSMDHDGAGKLWSAIWRMEGVVTGR